MGQDYDPFSAITVDEPTALEMAKARAAALRGQNYAGIVMGLAHNPQAAKMGGELMEQAQQGLTQLGQLPGHRMQQLLHQQALQKEQREAAPYTDPAQAALLAKGQQQAAQMFGGSIPAGASPTTGGLLLQQMEKAAAIPKYTSVYPGSRMYNVHTGLPAEGPGGEQAPDIIKQTADGIQAGNIPPDMKGLGKLRGPVQAELAVRGDNLSQRTLDWQATQKNLLTMNSGGQVRLNQAINFVSDTIPVIEHLYNEWEQLGPVSGFKVLNRAALTAMKNLPGRAGAVATTLDAAINDFAAELGTVYKGGGTSTDASLEKAGSNLRADWNPETFRAALNLAKTNIAIRKASVAHSNVAGASAGNQYNPAAKQVGAGGAEAVPTTTAPTAPDPNVIAHYKSQLQPGERLAVGPGGKAKALSKNEALPAGFTEVP